MFQMVKHYYENLLSNQNYIAKPNTAWAVDFTSFELVKLINIEINKIFHSGISESNILSEGSKIRFKTT